MIGDPNLAARRARMFTLMSKEIQTATSIMYRHALEARHCPALVLGRCPGGRKDEVGRVPTDAEDH